MNRFVDVKLNDEIYSLVFGLGKVIFVLTKSLRLDGYYVFQVEYLNGQRVYYTQDGKPDWCQDSKNCSKTICYKHEIDFDKLDVKPKDKILKQAKIIRLRHKEILEMMSPAGGWIDANLMPNIMIDNAIKNEEYHLFRKMKEKK
ncbi:MAG: hypothetical protein QM493_01195 [Sulfurovum sp.]